MRILFIFLFILEVVNSFKYLLPTTSFSKKIENQEIQVIEPFRTETKDTYSLIFLTGGNNIIPGDIYNNFLNTLASHRFSINLVPGNFNNYEKLLNDLSKEYKGIVVMQHSSSTILSVQLSKLNEKIKKLIFLDPVDNRIFFKEYRKFDNKIDLNSPNKILFLRAKKAYKWGINPPSVPFIPFLSLNPNSFNFKNKCKVITVEANDFGHTDILDKTWADFMHNSRISNGNENRKAETLDEYYKWLSQIIHYFCYHNDNQIKNILKNGKIESDLTYY